MHGLFCWVVSIHSWSNSQLKTRQKYKIFRLIYNVKKKKHFFFFDGDKY